MELFTCVSSLHMYKCCLCEFETSMKVSLSNHIKVVHEERGTKFVLKQIIHQCNKCEFQTFSVLVLLKLKGNCTHQLLKETVYESMDPRQANSGGEDVHNVSSGSNPPTAKPHKKLGTTDFVSLLGTKDESYYIDKTKLVQVFLNCEGSRVLVTLPRRFGKTINITMLKVFFESQITAEERKTLSEKGLQKRIKQTENYKLFQEHGLVITENLALMETHFGQYPVIIISFKCDRLIESVDNAMTFCKGRISATFEKHEYLMYSMTLNTKDKEDFTKWYNNKLDIKNENDVDMISLGLHTLAKYLYKHFNRKIVLLIDEYDSVITKAIQMLDDTKVLQKVIEFCTGIIAAAVKEDPGENWVEYAFITGICHISGMGLSGSNVAPYGFLGDHDFVRCYGLTTDEVKPLLQKTYEFDQPRIDEVEKKFNGYSTVKGEKIYNIWSVLDYAGKTKKNEGTYGWQDTGYIVGLQEAFRFPTIMQEIQTKLLFNEPIKISDVKCFRVKEVLKLVEIIGEKVDPAKVDYPNPDVFFSFIFQQGYLTYVAKKPGLLKIPNEQIKEEFKKKITDFNIGVISTDKEFTENCREFFLKISETKCEHEDFRKFYVNLAAVVRQYAAKWLTKNEANLRCIMHMLVSDLERFKVCAEVSFKLEDGKQRKIDLIIVKDDFAMFFELKYKKSNIDAMLCIEERNYLQILDAKNIIRVPVNHYVIMGINMDENGHVSIGYLQDNQNFNDMTLIP